MTTAPRRQLTVRECTLLDGIDRRLPLKVIAGELGISESRVNQHVRALKTLYQVNTLPDLVDAWRQQDIDNACEPDCRNSTWRISQVPGEQSGADNDSRVAPGEFVLSDSAFYAIEAPWRRDEPSVVPGVLDGPNAVILRLAVIVGLAFGILAAIVLAVTASLSLSEALEGNTASPADSSTRPG